MDWDKDGILDILSGCYWSDDARAAHIEWLAGLGNMDFAEATPLLNASGEPLTNVSQTEKEKDAEVADGSDVEWRNICTHQFAVDYDDDGDLDLVVGCIGSELFFVENTGGDGKPVLSDQPQQLDVTVPNGHGGPHLADWDGDGDLDMLTGNADGGIYLSENIGTRSAPEWSKFKQLFRPTGAGEQTTDGGNKIIPGRDTRVWTFDFNGDGLLDLLVGDNVTIANAKPGLSKEESARLKSEYKKELQEAQKEMMKYSQDYFEAQKSGEVDKELKENYMQASKKYGEVYQKKSEFLDETRTGFVWLLVRKPDAEIQVTKR